MMALKPIQVSLYMPISLRLSENLDTIGWVQATQGLTLGFISKVWKKNVVGANVASFFGQISMVFTQRKFSS